MSKVDRVLYRRFQVYCPRSFGSGQVVGEVPDGSFTAMLEWKDGSKIWYENGLPHRLDAPAIDWADGGEEWYYGGALHRTEGPAVTFADGRKEWWANGVKVYPSNRVRRMEVPYDNDTQAYLVSLAEKKSKKKK